MLYPFTVGILTGRRTRGADDVQTIRSIAQKQTGLENDFS